MNGIISLLSKVYHSKHVWFQELTHKSFYCLYKSKVNFHYSCSVFFPSFLLYGSFIAHYNAMPMEIRWRHSVETYTALRIIRKKNKPIFFLFWRHFVPLSRKHVIQSQQDARKINASIIQKRCENNGPNAKKRHQAKEKSDWIDWRSWSMEHGAVCLRLCLGWVEGKHSKWNISSGSSINKLSLWFYTFAAIHRSYMISVAFAPFVRLV